jgi:hypothetical protein
LPMLLCSSVETNKFAITLPSELDRRSEGGNRLRAVVA